MQTILLHIHDDDGSEARVRAAISLARRDNAQLVCLQVTPRSAYVSGDMFGNIYAAPDIMAAVNAYETKLRDDTHARLANEAVEWTYEQTDGDPARAVVQRARLIDLVVLGRARRRCSRATAPQCAGRSGRGNRGARRRHLARNVHAPRDGVVQAQKNLFRGKTPGLVKYPMGVSDVFYQTDT